jgi:uncharacterized protein YkwD
MTSWRALTVTIATGLCVFGTGLTAAEASTPAPSGSLIRAAKSAPWKTAMSRKARYAAPATVTVAAPKAPSAPAAVVTVTDPAVSFAAKIVTLVNNQRAAAGLRPVVASTCAQGFATSWSRHMAATGDFSHQSLTPFLSSCVARGAGENIAFGVSTPEAFMDMWMNSAGHKANILRSTFTHIGVGVAKSPSGTWYATQDFLTI